MVSGHRQGDDGLKDSPKRGRRDLSSWLTVAAVVVVVLIIRLFVFEPFTVSGDSMEPTLLNGDRVMVSKLAFDFGKPKTGEVVVFHSPVAPKQDWIKRVIGLPGETVSIRNDVVYINGHRYPEPFLKYRSSQNVAPLVVPPGHIWVLGDNRPISDDSRYWGPLAENRIIGRALFVWWPISQIKWLG